jgi:hypothetical protein
MVPNVSIVNKYVIKADKFLNIAGENNENVFSGREIVSWYNSVLNFDLNIDLSSVRDMIIVGFIKI